MKIKSNNPLFAIASALALTTSAKAVNSSYSAGDLILYFQKLSGSSITNTVYIDLGPATNFRGTAIGPDDVANQVNIANINSTLTTAFGAGWATDPGVFAGVAGVFSASASNTVTNGDIARTIYISAPRTSVGTIGSADSAAWELTNTSPFSTGAGDIQQQNNVFGDTDPLNQHGYNGLFIVSDPAVSAIDDNNGLSVVSGNLVVAPSFEVFDGGAQQMGSAGTFGNFGAGGTAEFALDLYRLVPNNGKVGEIDGIISGSTRTGSYEGTVVVNTSGQVSFITHGTATLTSFQTWAQSFPALDTPEKQLPAADPDNDGMNNLLEFVLNGNPGTQDNSSVAPTLNAAGNDFVFSFNRRDDSETGNTLVFQFSSDLAPAGWTDVTIGATGGTVGNATIGITENATSPDAITVTIPKSAAPGGSLFGRLKVTQP